MSKTAIKNEAGPSAALPDAGMPPIDLTKQPVSFFEFWPMPLFYAPVALYWLGLSLRHGSLTLPTAANPGLPDGGLVGEAKSLVFAAMGRNAQDHVAPFRRVVRGSETAATLLEAGRAMAEAGLSYPVVAKPDIACRGAGVKLIRERMALGAYIDSFPEGAAFLVQELVDKEGEAGVFYVRRPGEAQGSIPSLTLKYFPSVTGDGQRTLGDLIAEDARAGQIQDIYRDRHAEAWEQVLAPGEKRRLAFAGNHSKGTIFRNGTAHVTEALRARIDEIARDIDGFYFGRFDVRFADFNAFLAGEDLTIIEVNGAGGEQTHIWDAETRLIDAYRALFDQFGTLFSIAAENRRKGARPSTLRDLIAAYRTEQRLTPLYPQPD